MYTSTNPNKQTVIVKTNDNFDRVFIDGEFASLQNKGWGQSFFSDARIFNGPSALSFVSAFGDNLQNQDFFLNQLKYVRSENEKAALFASRVSSKDPTILYAVGALAVAPILAGELIAVSPILASGANQLAWDAGALYNASNLVVSAGLRRLAYSTAMYGRPILLSPAVGTAAWKAGHKTFVELIHFSRKGNVDIFKTGKNVYETYKKIDRILD